MRAFTLLLTLVFTLFLTQLSSQCSVTISRGDDFSVDGVEICLGQSLFLSAADGQTGIPNGTTFQWSTGSTNYHTTVTPTVTTNYGVVVTYPDGCVATDAVTVVVRTPPSLSIQNITDATCGSSNGSATAVATGNGGYSYSWSDGSSGSTITNVAAGSYKVTVTDGNGCTAISSTVIGVQGASGISGTVYGDFNYNAVNDQVYQGYSNLAVKLYGANSTLVSTTTTDVDGNYSFTGVSFNNGESYRMEFDVPANYEVTTNGDVENLQVRFINGPTCNQNLAISVPTDYCHTEDPRVIVACYVNGDPLSGGTSGTLDAIVSTNYKNQGFPSSVGYATPDHDAISSQVGSVYGIAYHRFSEIAFFSAYAKRHVGFGPGGIGAIYAIDYSSGNAGAPYEYLDLVGDFGLNLGNIVNRDLPTDFGSPSYDVDAFAKIGKVGIGDIDISDDGATMFITNLNDRTLVQIGIGNPVAAPTLQSILPIPNPCTTPSDWRPFGLKYYAGKLYVGGVCSGESSGNQPTGYIYEYTPGTGFNSTPILTMAFDYTRENAFGCSSSAGGTGDTWRAWTSTYKGGGWPQPIIADIEFEVDGSMILGIRDRNADMIGFQNYQPDASMTNTGLYSGLAVGDILRADPTGNGSYVLENNGISQGKTGCGSGNNQGPGGGEFFCGDYKLCHNEGATGALAKYAGSGEVLSTVYDPLRSYSQGFSRFNSINGTGFEGYEVFRDDVNDPAGFGKANGLGDIEVLCKPAPIEVGDYVWIDVNKNGIQDPGEQPIAGITISLYDDAGNLLEQTVTNAKGYYYFYNLEYYTDYFVAIDNYNDGLLYNGNTYSPTIVDAGTNDNIDSDSEVRGFGVPNTLLNKPSIAFTTGLPGETDHSLDFGFFGCSLEVTAGPDVKICRGLTVTLTANVTGATGTKTFEWSNGTVGQNNTVNPAVNTNYVVTVTDALGCQGTDDIMVSVENPPVLGIVSPSFLCPNDAGVFQIPNATAGATYLWDFAGGITADGDANDISETVHWPASYAGQTINITLTGKSGALQCESVDDVNITLGGLVEANAGNDKEICQGTFTTIGGTSAFVAPQGGTISWSPASYLSSTTISNPQVNLPFGVASITYTVTVTNNGCTSTDMVTVTGLDCKMSLGSTVFIDTNNNGIQDAGENGIANVAVQLQNSTGAVIANSTTDNNGNYYFGGLDPGQYRVAIPTPSSLYPKSSTPTDTNDNGDDGDDNGIQTGGSGTTTISPLITLAPGTEPTNETFQGGTQDDANDADGDMTVDFGFVPQLMSLGSTVFVDSNNDGILNANEAGIAGVTVELIDGNGTPVDGTVTDENGNYFFENIVPGTYQVRVTPSSDYPTSSTNTDTADNDEDNDDNGIQTGGAGTVTISPMITLTPDTETTNEPGQGGNQDNADDANGNMTVDFGFVPQLMSIGSTVFADPNDNGFQDAGEAGISGITVELLNNNGIVVNTTTTDNNGNYYFGALLPGIYQVRVTPNNEYPTSSSVTDTNDNSQDGDDNGIQSAGSGSATVSTLITLSPGTESTNETSQGGNQDNGDDANGDMTIDFGFIPQLMSVGSTVFADINDNGLQDTDESGIAGITVELLDSNGQVVETQTTDNNGNYYFTNIVPGQYQVRITPNVDYPLSSTPTDTADNGEDGDDNGSQPNGSGTSIISTLFTLAPNTEPTNEPGQGGNQDNINDANGDMTIDFGLRPQMMSIGSTTFVDGNDNGLQDADESGIANLLVELLDSNGSVINSMNTDASGNYYFDNLIPGVYQVRVTPNIDYPTSSTPTDTNDNSQDGDDNGIQSAGKGSPVLSPMITLTAGTETTNETSQGGNQDDASDANGDMTIDFGFVPQFMSVGSTVFVDNNDNGLQDTNDQGIANIVVRLLDSNGAIVKITTTDGDGNYYFDNILPGDYQVEVVPSTEFPSSSTATDLADNNQDSDDNGDQPNGTGTTVISGIFNLSPGTEVTNEPGDGGNQDIADDSNGNMTIDFGFKPEVDVYLEKSVNATTPYVGDIVTFTILVGNDGPTTATGVEVTDLLPSGYTYSSYNVSQGAYNPSTGLWTVGTLSVTQTETLTVNAIVRANGDYLNLAEVTDMDQPDTDSEPGDGIDTDGDGNVIDDPQDDDDGDAAIVMPINTADVSLEKSVNNKTPYVGETVTFSIDVKNDGPAVATGVEVTDLLPTGYTFIGFSVSKGTYNETTGIWTVGTLPLDQVETLTVNARVEATGSYLNYAEVTDMDQPDTDSEPGDGVDTDGDGNVIDDPQDDDDGDAEEVIPITLMSIGSTVFLDNNNNGLLDGNDSGIPEIVVQLLDNTGAVVGTTTTDNNGNYYFGSLIPGQYQVRVTPGALYPISSTPTDNADNSQDNDDNGAQVGGAGTMVLSPIITLSPGTESTSETGLGATQDDANDANGDMTVDFGFIPSVDVYLEKSVNNKTPIVGETVTFTILVGNEGPNTATNVEVTDLLPSGYTYAGFATTQGSYTPSTGLWTVGTLTINETHTLTVNAIVKATGDYLNIAEVTDMDQPDIDSQPSDGVDTDGDGDLIDDPQDDDDGDAEEVTVNTYVDVYLEKSIDIISPPVVGDLVTFSILVGNEGPNTATGVEVTDLLPSGYTYSSFNVTQGSYNPTTGLWNVGTLLNGGTATLQVSAFVKSSGDYLNIAEVTDMDQPDIDSEPDDGVDTDGDGDLIDDPQDDDDGDAEEVQPYTLAAITGSVFLDDDNNDTPDSPQVGVPVLLTKDTNNNGVADPGELQFVMVTDENGYYEFLNLVPGDYIVTTSDPDGASSISDQDESNDGDPNDNDTTVDNVIDVRLTSGETDSNNDFVDRFNYVEFIGSIAGNVSLDTTGDGIIDEPQVGVKVILTEDLNNNGVIDAGEPQTTTYTDENGDYMFPNLQPGDYLVTTTDPTGTTSILDHDKSNDGDPGDNDTRVDNTIDVTLDSSEVDTNNDFVDQSILVALGNYVWEDTNANGVQDVNEVGVNGVVVNLYDRSNPTVRARTTTTANEPETNVAGFYEFTNLTPGTYFVEFVIPQGYIITRPNNTLVGNEMTDSDVDNTNGANTTADYTILTGRNDNIDAGIYKTASLGDFVWLDSNGLLENQQDASDIGLNGVMVNLYDAFGTLIRSTETSNDPVKGEPGFYLFSDLPAGSYSVEFVKPDNYTFVQSGVGSNNVDSDVVNTTTGRTALVNLLPGDNITTVDAGLTSVTLPVQLVDFYGSWNKSRDLNELTWITASELDNDYFIVERSIDNTTEFVEIGKVESYGDSYENVTYNLDDNNLTVNGIYYYRLKQVDLNGSYKYSNIINIVIGRGTELDVNLFPNPAINETTVRITDADQELLNVTIYDIKGKVISQSVVDTKIESGNSDTLLDISDLPAGSYVVRIKVGKNVFIEKLSVIR